MTHTLRSATTTAGRRMAGARSLWRANGMKEEQFGKPIIAIVNSFTQFVPGHVHLHDIGQRIKAIIEAQGCFAAEFDTIAIDDGIAMGHDGMLYSLPSRELIADSVEYMMNAHMADAMICISNCDKITPGMMMAAMRLNVPAIFVSGGPMEAGTWKGRKYDLIDAMVMSADSAVPDADIRDIEFAACPSCGSCSGLFTANSMNCLNEALGIALPGNGTVVATHTNRLRLFENAARRIVEMTNAYYETGDDSVLPRSIATRKAFVNAMSLDIAMGGSTNTVLHLLAIAHAAGVAFTMKDIDALSRKIPVLCKVAPSSHFHVEDVNRAGGIMGIMGELARAGLVDGAVPHAAGASLGEVIRQNDILDPRVLPFAIENCRSAPGGGQRNLALGSQDTMYPELDKDRQKGCIRSAKTPYSKDGGLAVLFGNIARKGCVVKAAGVAASMFRFSRSGKGVPFAGPGRGRHPRAQGEGRRRCSHHPRRPQGRARHAGNAVSHVVSAVHASERHLRPAHRRQVLRGIVRFVNRPCFSRSRRGRRRGPAQKRRHHRGRHTRPESQRETLRGRARQAQEGRIEKREKRVQAETQARGFRGAQGVRAVHHLGRQGGGARIA